ncbi:MAG TPA: hypothetical protein VFF68_05795 [Anaerolineaceae bacterium]|nr:hypothetical protein [Anaerolineaceae bacterium]
MQEQRARFQLDAHPEGGGFEIVAMTAGEGNGWQFTPAALQASLALWDGVECFVDHAAGPRSLRDLAGLCTRPQWDAACQGIRLRLQPAGPSGPLLSALGSEMLAEGPRPRVGFSADVLFHARGPVVQTILRVLSVDLVFNPARGGAFLRETNQSRGATEMETQPVQTPTPEPAAEPAAPAQPPLPGLAQPEAVQSALCAHLLEAALREARLPGAAAEMVRRQFAGRAFSPSELESAILAQRQLVGELTGAGAVAGVRAGASVHAMFDSDDQVRAALHDLLGAPRPGGLEGARPARLSGIRELYTLLTGDTGFSGGFYPERARLATSANLPNLLRNALNKLVLVQWEELGRAGYRWWEPVVSVEHFNSLQDLTGVLVGEVTALPPVAEGAPYTELAVTDSAETGAWGKYGGYVALTLEMFERDETHKLRQYPRKLASAALRRISALVGAVFTDGGGTGPGMADGRPVFHVEHGNLGGAALDSAGWEAACQAIYQQRMAEAGGNGPRLALDAKYCLVPRTQRLAAMQVLYPSFAHEANIFSENLQRGEMGDVITCPEFTDPNDWAAAADPRLAPGIIVGERFGLLPEIIIADNETGGALFTNDEIRMKVRHWVSVFVADHRPLYKANVAP